MTDYAYLKRAWVASVMAHGAAALLPHFADVNETALAESLAPAFGYEAQMTRFQEEALANQAQQARGLQE